MTENICLVYNPDQTVDSCVYTVTGTNYQTVSYSPSPFNTYPPILKDGLNRIDCDQTYTDKVGDLMSHTYDGPDNPDISSNLINSSFVQIYRNNSESQQKLNDNVQELDQELNDIFNGFLNSPDIESEDIDSLPFYISVFKNVAKIVAKKSWGKIFSTKNTGNLAIQKIQIQNFTKNLHTRS